MVLYKHTIVGIDPGLLGAVATLYLNTRGMVVNIEAQVMPLRKEKTGKYRVDAAKLYSMLLASAYRDGCKPLQAAFEATHAMPKQGVVSSYNFGLNTGVAHAIIEILRIPLLEPTPQQWMKLVLGPTLKKKTKQKRSKESSIKFVKETYPYVNLLATQRSTTPHDGLAESICIATYALRVLLQPHGGLLPKELSDGVRFESSTDVR